MHKLQKSLNILVAFSLTPHVLAADYDIDLPVDLEQSIFADLVKDLGAVISYRAITPAEHLGELGVDLGIELTGTSMETDALSQVTTGNAPSTVYAPKIHVHKGLPMNIDLGAVYSVLPESNIRYFGAEIRYAFLEGGVGMPALALRGTYSVLTGVEHFDLSSAGIELTLSKGFTLLTPYAGVGSVWLGGDSDHDTLSSESFTEFKYFVGLNTNFGLVNLAAEWDKTGDNNSYSAKLGFRF